MGKVYKCIGRKANKPFFLEKICCNIFSAEELVYCIYDNTELLEKDIFTTELANWLEDECEATGMADRMYQLLSKKADTAQFVQALLEAFPFISSGQQARFLELLGEENNDSGPERRKKRGDYFLQKDRYVHALKEYEAALADTLPEEAELQADIYHSMGMARAGLFLLEQAKQDFIKAYELDGKEEHYYYYAACMRFSMSDSEYIRTISDDVQMREITLRLESKMQEANSKWESGPGIELEELKQKNQAAGEEQFAEWIEKTITDCKEEYRRCIQ
ncbi:MAG: hypothetical protein IJ397_06085 [Lachnospiraceae bacterium]|nr:hypothetical protein [Lachnospiraceae bacterium]